MSSTPTTARIACVSPAFIEQATATQLDDWIEYFSPDAVLLTGSSPAPRAASILQQGLDAATELFNPAGDTTTSGSQILTDIQFVVAPTMDTLRDISGFEHRSLVQSKSTFVISDLLALDVDTTALSTSLVGLDEYVAALNPTQLAGEYVHISAQLPAEYRREWGGLAVRGGGVEAGYAGSPLVALDCRADGRVLTRTVKPSKLGLQALDDVADKRARTLRDAGYTSRSDVAEADSNHLAELQGIGQTVAERIQQSAEAIADGDVVRKSDEPLPSGDPVYIDIETDGLNPTITWLIGVLDGNSEDGEYLSFLQTDPAEPGQAIEEFMAWYTTNASHRPIVAYGGWNFDFDVLHDHIIDYCPHYEDDWTSSYRFDPYDWAVKENNAILPGRTNTLEDVADALGYERAETGLTGAAVARAYRQWMTDQSSDTELDWDRFDTYCEDDVRALAVINEALEDSSRIVSTDEPSRDISETTTQGSLSDW
jgi:uncharacterized protein YprB with RNaseH-like and TPR domain